MDHDPPSGIDVERQVEHWCMGALEDMDAADTLMQKGKVRHSLFFAHLSLEKMLKALVSRATRKVPPYIHALPRLAELAKADLPEPDMEFLADFDTHNIRGRYGRAVDDKIHEMESNQSLDKAKEMLTCLHRML